jgi:LacI family transcriptional regulator
MSGQKEALQSVDSLFGAAVTMHVTIKKIAKVTGVHPSTVSRALSHDPKISEDRRKQILEVAASLGYRPNLMVRAMQGKRTNTIGVLTPMLTDMHCVSLVNRQETWFRQRGMMVMLAITELEEQTELKALQNLTDRAVDGLIVNYPPYHKAFEEALSDLAVRKKLPIVVVGGSDFKEFDSVDVDLTKWSFNLVEHLIACGHRRIAKISDYFEYERGETINSKLAGYKEALASHRIPFDSELVFQAHYAHQDVRNLMERIMSLAERPTAIFAYSDDLACALIDELLAAGYKVPEDVSVVGFNDDWYAGRISVPLTTCKLPAEEIAEGAAELLTRRMETPSLEPMCRMYDCQLKVRSSVAQIVRS